MTYDSSVSDVPPRFDRKHWGLGQPLLQHDFVEAVAKLVGEIVRVFSRAGRGVDGVDPLQQAAQVAVFLAVRRAGRSVYCGCAGLSCAEVCRRCAIPQALGSFGSIVQAA